MSNEQSIRDEMKVLLDDHSHCYDSDCGMDFGCSCDAIGDYDNSAIEHAGHLADVLLASPVIRRIQAEAIRTLADFQDAAIRNIAYAADDEDRAEVNRWTVSARVYADRIERGETA